MLSTVTEYAYRPTDGRRQNVRNVHINSPSSQASDILFSKVLKKNAARLMIWLVPNIKKLYILVLGTMLRNLEKIRDLGFLCPLSFGGIVASKQIFDSSTGRSNS